MNGYTEQAGSSSALNSGNDWNVSDGLPAPLSDCSMTQEDSAVNGESPSSAPAASTPKKTRGRVKIETKFIKHKQRRYTTFSKRKSGLMKKAYELSTLTGAQVMLLVASETGHVYTYATDKFKPIMPTSGGEWSAEKEFIQNCLSGPDVDEVPTREQEQ